MKPRVAKTGEKYGQLKIIDQLPRLHVSGRPRRIVLCKCDCGTERIAFVDNLRAGYTTSCGCHRLARATASLVTHGMSDVPEYTVWQGMHQRCKPLSKRDDAKRYGGRGIVVCERWNDFAAFYADMGPRPSPHHSIDRRNTNGNYEKDNCRWATPDEQANNRRTSHLITYRGETLSIAQWARRLQVPYGRLKQRVQRGAWP